MSNLIDTLKKGQNLSFDESKSLFSELMEGKYEEDDIVEILEALIKKGESELLTDLKITTAILHKNADNNADR